jgi:hypothetical protein
LAEDKQMRMVEKTDKSTLDVTGLKPATFAKQDSASLSPSLKIV